MKKNPDPWWKKFLVPILISAVGIPTVAMCWNSVVKAFADTQKITTIEQAIVQNSNTQKDLTSMVVEQRERNDRQDAAIDKQKEISQLQIDSLKGLLAVMKR